MTAAGARRASARVPQFHINTLVNTHHSEKAPTDVFYLVKAPNTRGPFTYYVSSYNKAGSVRMLTNADLRDQGFIENLMSYENP